MDSIAFRFIKESLTAIASVWKHGIKTAIFKSGDAEEINNHLLPVLEKVIVNQQSTFSESIRLISETAWINVSSSLKQHF